MTKKPKSLFVYDRQPMAERYQRTKGFAALRKEKLLEVTLDLLIALTADGATLLELGAGTGHFTGKIFGWLFLLPVNRLCSEAFERNELLLT